MQGRSRVLSMVRRAALPLVWMKLGWWPQRSHCQCPEPCSYTRKASPRSGL